MLFNRKILFLIIATIIINVFFQNAGAVEITVAQDGSGDYTKVQYAIGNSRADDIIYIKPGTYNLQEFSKDINYPLSIIGEDKDTTILTNGGPLKFHKSLTVKNLTFKDYSSGKGYVFNIVLSSGEVMDGVFFENCIFENTPSAIASYVNSELGPRGTIKNFNVKGCTFKNIIGDGSTYGIMIHPVGNGKLLDVHITQNRFENIRTRSSIRGASAIWLGSNACKDSGNCRDMWIVENYIDTVYGPVGTEDDNIEVHGVIGFGYNINIIDNVIKDINYSPDHEAIYIKASESTIENNYIVNGGGVTWAGDITIKGDLSKDNLVFGNVIIGDQNQKGTGIWAYGSGDIATINNNCIKKPAATYAGMVARDRPGQGKVTVTVSGNRIETRKNSLSVVNAKSGEVSKNLLISYQGTPLTISKSSVNKYSNIEYSGTDYGDLVPPEPTCQNSCYRCCESCNSGHQEQFDSTCKNGRLCCSECQFPSGNSGTSTTTTTTEGSTTTTTTVTSSTTTSTTSTTTTTILEPQEFEEPDCESGLWIVLNKKGNVLSAPMIRSVKRHNPLVITPEGHGKIKVIMVCFKPNVRVETFEKTF